MFKVASQLPSHNYNLQMLFSCYTMYMLTIQFPIKIRFKYIFGEKKLEPLI